MSFIDLPPRQRQKSVYRYLDFGRLVEIFKTKQLTFVVPAKWNDPFENYIINPLFKYEDGGFHGLHSNIYGSCWSRKSVSDALWSIYSPNKISVRIKSTPSLIDKALEKAFAKNSGAKWFIGKVQYLSQAQILHNAESLANQILDDTSSKALAKTLLLKRSSFSHEQEVRVLIVNATSRPKNGIIKIKIDPHEIIQSILVDSRASDEWLDVYATYMKKEIGFKGKISKSQLYKPIDQLIIKRASH